jgi:hypothetical protein
MVRLRASLSLPQLFFTLQRKTGIVFEDQLHDTSTLLELLRSSETPFSASSIRSIQARIKHLESNIQLYQVRFCWG